MILHEKIIQNSVSEDWATPAPGNTHKWDEAYLVYDSGKTEQIPAEERATYYTLQTIVKILLQPIVQCIENVHAARHVICWNGQCLNQNISKLLTYLPPHLLVRYWS